MHKIIEWALSKIKLYFGKQETEQEGPYDRFCRKFEEKKKRRKKVMECLTEEWAITQIFRQNYTDRMCLGKPCLHCAIEQQTRPYPLNNLEEIANRVAESEEQTGLILQPEALEEELVKLLKGREHKHRYEKSGDPATEYTEWFPYLQQLRCWLLLQELAKPDFVQQISHLIEQNPKDGKTELGGLITLDFKKRIVLEQKMPAVPGNRSFSMSFRELTKNPHLASFHLHALQEDCSQYAGPSYKKYGENNREQTDIEQAKEEAWDAGESHNVVITKLKGRRFSMHYYGAQMQYFDPHASCVSLGCYEY